MRGQERAEVVSGGQGRQAAEQVTEIVVGIESVAQTAHDERVEGRGVIAGVGMTDKEPVLHAEFARADGVFDGVGVEAGLAVAQMCGQGLSVVEQVG